MEPLIRWTDPEWDAWLSKREEADMHCPYERVPCEPKDDAWCKGCFRKEIYGG